MYSHPIMGCLIRRRTELCDYDDEGREAQIVFPGANFLHRFWETSILVKKSLAGTMKPFSMKGCQRMKTSSVWKSLPIYLKLAHKLLVLATVAHESRRFRLLGRFQTPRNSGLQLYIMIPLLNHPSRQGIFIFIYCASVFQSCISIERCMPQTFNSAPMN